MSDAGELTIGDLIALAAKKASGQWEENFIIDLETRFETYGERTYLSPKQRTILERIADAVPRFEPLDDVGDDGYKAPAPTLHEQDVYMALRAQITLDLGQIAIDFPKAPGLVLDALLRIVADHGWRFVPDKPTREMCEAWSNDASPFLAGSAVARAHAEIVYREMLQKAPTIGKGA